MPIDDNNYKDSQIDHLIKQSAKRGARLALDELGLSDDKAAQDLKDLRLFLCKWRGIRGHIMEVAIKVMVHIFIVAMIATATAFLWISSK